MTWNFEISGSFARKLDGAASTLENGVGPRNSRKSTYGTQFRGYYADLWASNIETANSDVKALAAALRNVAQGVRDLENDAREEQKRIDAAREWKRKHDERNAALKWADEHLDPLHLMDDRPPQQEPKQQMNKTYEQPAKGERKPFQGTGGSGGTSSALPDDLRSWSKGERADTDAIRQLSQSLTSLANDFISSCKWGQLSCGPVFKALNTFISSNDTDCARTDVVALNFETYGGSGTVSTVSNAAISESLRAHGISEQRTELEIPNVQAIGNPPTSGYSNDPINTATGNFVENEEDLRFDGGASLLGWVRSYSSLSTKVGGHGPGWASFDGCCLRFTDEGAHWSLVDGREIVFPRQGSGFGRATHENYWLEAVDGGYVISNNTGARWTFTGSGVPERFTLTDGATIFFEYDGACLVGISHARGHRLELAWEDGRITAVVADDGRRMDYVYDSEGRLIEATGPLGSRRYEWNDQGLIVAVIDADGVVEARNVYDDQARVVAQESQFGRITRFGYLPGRVTVVSDEDGSRSNTWVADARGRLVAVVDSDDNRSSMAYDRYGNQVLTTDAEGQQTARDFDQRGRLVAELKPNGALTRLSYDERDRLTDIVSFDDGAEVTRTHMQYDGVQQSPCLVRDGEGAETKMTWRDGLLLAVEDATGVAVQFAYDVHGDIVSSTDADGSPTPAPHGDPTDQSWRRFHHARRTPTPSAHRGDPPWPSCGRRVCARKSSGPRPDRRAPPIAQRSRTRSAWWPQTARSSTGRDRRHRVPAA